MLALLLAFSRKKNCLKQNFRGISIQVYGWRINSPSKFCWLQNIFNLSNNLHLNTVFTLEPAKVVVVDSEVVQTLDFLHITIILRECGKIETDVHYKLTNAHKYFNFHSFHPQHCKDNIPYNLAKRIIVFVSNSEKMEYRLQELEKWLLECEYPLIMQILHSRLRIIYDFK